MNEYISISENEMDILELLWKAGRALSRPELLEGLANRQKNPNALHQVLNGMMKKGILKVEGIVLCGKVYGRTYAPTMSQNEFLIHRTEEVLPDLSLGGRVLRVVSALTDQEGIDEETIAELEELLKARKQELSET